MLPNTTYLTSGELLFRASGYFTQPKEEEQEEQDQRSNLIPEISPTLISFLSRGYDATHIQETYAKKLKRLNKMKEYAQASSRHRIEQAQIVRQRMSHMIESILTQHRSASNDSIVHVGLLRMLEQKFAAYLVHYYAVIEAELEELKMRGQIEQRACREMYDKATLALAHRQFFFHLEYETSRDIVVQHLSDTNAQFVRCRRAAMDNVKSDFFHSTPYRGLSVSQVFKIENAPLLREFHAMTKRHPNGKIKGLFCVVPAECLERMIVYGMHPQDCDDSSVHEGEEEGVSTSASRSRGQRKSPLFCPSWSSYAIDGHKIQPNISEPHMAQKRVMSSHDLPFPRQFSRYSTLEEMKTSWSGDSGVVYYYLALCRVLVENLKVVKSKSAYESSLQHSAPAAQDALYFQDIEEYSLSSGQYILPEFVVQYQYVPKEDHGVSMDPMSSDVAPTLPTTTSATALVPPPAPLATLPAVVCNLANTSSSILPDPILRADWMMMSSTVSRKQQRHITSVSGSEPPIYQGRPGRAMLRSKQHQQQEQEQQSSGKTRAETLVPHPNQHVADQCRKLQRSLSWKDIHENATEQRDEIMYRTKKALEDFWRKDIFLMMKQHQYECQNQHKSFLRYSGSNNSPPDLHQSKHSELSLEIESIRYSRHRQNLVDEHAALKQQIGRGRLQLQQEKLKRKELEKRLTKKSSSSGSSSSVSYRK